MGGARRGPRRLEPPSGAGKYSQENRNVSGYWGTGRLDNPACDRGYLQFAELLGPTRPEDLAFPHRHRPEPAVL
jgi:hypothetical protein